MYSQPRSEKSGGIKFKFIELLADIVLYCRPKFLKEKFLYNFCGVQSSAGGALVRISTDKYGKIQSKAPRKPAWGVHHNACKASKCRAKR